MIEPKSVLKPMYWVCMFIVVMLLSAVCSSETPSVMSAARQAKLAELTGQLRLGAEYFLNRTDTQAYVEKQFESMHATGLTVVQQWIAAPSLANASHQQVSLTEGSPEIIFRGMVQADGFAVMLSNWGDEQKAVVSFLGDYRVVDTMTGETVAVTEENGRTLATVNMPARAVAVLKNDKTQLEKNRQRYPIADEVKLR